jgi:hypothetical protein
MIDEARTLGELEALERHLPEHRAHPLYQRIVASFATRIRELDRTGDALRLRAPRLLTTSEIRRIARVIRRAASRGELEAIADRILLRFCGDPRRDELEALVRRRREDMDRLPTLEGLRAWRLAPTEPPREETPRQR